MSGYLESIRGNDKVWRLAYYTAFGEGRKYRTDIAGKILEYPTKAACEKARREFEKGTTGFTRVQSDFYVGKKKR